MIQANNLARRYGRRWALAGVSLHVPAGSVLMVAGRNGSGKSTLFRVLSTAIRPDAGNATIAGWDIRKDREDIRKSVALLTHQSYLYESLTARENLRVFADHLGKPASLDGLLNQVDLGPRADDPVSTFSAGMRKRLSFARVLLQEPSVVMLDEPYGQLDPEGFELVDEVVRTLKARRVTILMATHQLERGMGLADNVLHLEEGRVRWFGRAHQAGAIAC